MFIHKDVFDYKVKGSRSENCILIDTNNWYVNTSNAVIGVNSRGGISDTNITEVLAANIPEGSKYKGYVKDGDIVLITTVASRMYCARTFGIPINFDGARYTDIPMAHVIGVFERRQITLPTLKLLGSYVMLTPYDNLPDGLVISTQLNKTTYKVVKVGPDSKEVSKGDIVLTRDNIVTEIRINGVPYGITTEDMIVGKFKNYTRIEDLEVLPTRIIMSDYMSKHAEGSSVLLNPGYDVHTDIDQVSEVYNEDRFKVIHSAVEGINSGDVLDILRETTNYSTLNGEKYFVVYGKQFINARIA